MVPQVCACSVAAPCASWYPAVAVAVAAADVNDIPSPLTSDSESSMTARMPSPIGHSSTGAGVVAVVPLFAWPFDFDFGTEEDEVAPALLWQCLWHPLAAASRLRACALPHYMPQAPTLRAWQRWLFSLASELDAGGALG